MDISPRLLEQFLALAEEQHFRRAAERLSMSQPPLTQAIHRLEKAVGAPLLERSSRRVSLTPAGAAFALDARYLLDAQQAAAQRARRIAAGAEGVLRIGFVSGISHRSLPDILRLLHAELPKLRIILHQNTSAELSTMVRHRRLDIAFIRAPLLDTRELDTSLLGTEPFVCAVPSDSPLAVAGSVPLSSLRAEAFALPSETGLPGLAELLFSYCRQAGFEPRDGGHANSLPGLIALVASGTCVSLVPGEIQETTTPGVTYLALIDEPHHIQTLIVTRTIRNDPVVDNVLTLIQRRPPHSSHN